MTPIRRNPNPLLPTQVERLGELLGPEPLFIITHHNPDPDALAAGDGLEWLIHQKFGHQARKIYSGLVARSENLAMLDHLTSGWKSVFSFSLQDANPQVILVDTQPGATNNILPTGLIPIAVFDHHEIGEGNLEDVPFVDLRTEIGSTSTMVYQYLEVSGLEIPARLATALFYGIKTDTTGLSRGSSIQDEFAYISLLRLIDRKALIQVENAQRPARYYRELARGLEQADIYGTAVVLYLGELHRADFTADMAEELIRLEGTRAALCMGQFADKLYLSMRTVPDDLQASHLLEKVIRGYGYSGGHGVVAGGQVLIQALDQTRVAQELIQRFVVELGEDPQGCRRLLE